MRVTVTFTSQINEHFVFLTIRAAERGSYSKDIDPRNIQAELTRCFLSAWEIMARSEVQHLWQRHSYHLKTEMPHAFGKRRKKPSTTNCSTLILNINIYMNCFNLTWRPTEAWLLLLFASSSQFPPWKERLCFYEALLVLPGKSIGSNAAYNFRATWIAEDRYSWESLSVHWTQRWIQQSSLSSNQGRKGSPGSSGLEAGE